MTRGIDLLTAARNRPASIDGLHACHDVRYTNRNWLTLFLPSEPQVEKAECCSAHQLASPSPRPCPGPCAGASVCPRRKRVEHDPTPKLETPRGHAGYRLLAFAREPSFPEAPSLDGACRALRPPAVGASATPAVQSRRLGRHPEAASSLCSPT